MNWTRLLQAGTAPYFTVIQDDDLWDPGFLARRVAFLQNHPVVWVRLFRRPPSRSERPPDRLERARRSLQSHNVADVLVGRRSTHLEEYIWSLYRHKLGGIHTAVDLQSWRDVPSVRARGGWAPVFDETYPFLYFDVELYLQDGVAVPDRLHRDQGRNPAGSRRRASPASCSVSTATTGCDIHEYHGHWFRRELPGLKLPRQYHRARRRRPHHRVARRAGARRPARACARSSPQRAAAASPSAIDQAPVRGERRRAGARAAWSRPARASPRRQATSQRRAPL